MKGSFPFLMSDTLTIDGRKPAVVRVGDTAECIKTNLYACIGATDVITNETKAFYSLMVGNGYFKTKPTPMTKSKLYIPKRSSPIAINYNTSTFPLGESYVRLEGHIPETVDIHYRYTGDASLFVLANLVNALRLKGAKTINLYCAYAVGCRSDRVNDDNEGEALSSKVYAEFINAMKFESVTILDPHSDVTVANLERCRAVSNTRFVKSILDDFNQEFFFISPDAGANKKIDSLAKKVGKGRVIRADKKRDVSNGSLVPGECVVYVPEGVSLKDQTCVIVDDICSRGGTFKTLAAELKKLGAKEVILIVSHYEDTADQDSLKASGITKVFTTNSLIEENKSNEFLNITNIELFLIK